MCLGGFLAGLALSIVIAIGILAVLLVVAANVDEATRGIDPERDMRGR